MSDTDTDTDSDTDADTKLVLQTPCSVLSSGSEEESDSDSVSDTHTVSDYEDDIENKPRFNTNTASEDESDSEIGIGSEISTKAHPVPMLHTIQHIYAHTRKQALSTVQKFDAFISFITEFTPCTDPSTVSKYLFFLGNTVYPEISKFMLTHSKCTDQMLTDILPHCKCSSLHKICESKDHTLFECFVTNTPFHMELLTYTYIDPGTNTCASTEPALFSIDSIKKIQCLVDANTFTKQILKNVTHNKHNFFQKIALGYNQDMLKYLLGLDICTHDVITHGIDPIDFVVRLFKNHYSSFISIVQSGKLSDELFDQLYNGKPLYFTFMDGSGRCCYAVFPQSPHCTVERVKAFFDSKHKNWDKPSGTKKHHPIMERFFGLEKFKCLKDMFYNNSEDKVSSVSNTVLNEKIV